MLQHKGGKASNSFPSLLPEQGGGELLNGVRVEADLRVGLLPLSRLGWRSGLGDLSNAFVVFPAPSKGAAGGFSVLSVSCCT